MLLKTVSQMLLVKLWSLQRLQSDQAKLPKKIKVNLNIILAVTLKQGIKKLKIKRYKSILKPPWPPPLTLLLL